MSDNWYIFGAGGLGVETFDILVDYLKSEGDTDVPIMFIDDTKSNSEVCGVQVKSSEDATLGKVTIALGDPLHRVKLRERLEAKGHKLASIVSPLAMISPMCKISRGVIVAPFSAIHSGAVVEANVAINTMTIVGHGVVVGENSVISSQVNLGGNVEVGEGAYIGMGALIKEGVQIGANSIIGMGSVVYKDIPEGVIALGNPARVMKKNEGQGVF